MKTTNYRYTRRRIPNQGQNHTFNKTIEENLPNVQIEIAVKVQKENRTPNRI